VIRVFEDREMPEDDPKRFRVEVLFRHVFIRKWFPGSTKIIHSPGADGDPLTDTHTKLFARTVLLNRSMTFWKMESCLHKAMDACASSECYHHVSSALRIILKLIITPF
jgi:hypothetical protein